MKLKKDNALEVTLCLLSVVGFLGIVAQNHFGEGTHGATVIALSSAGFFFILAVMYTANETFQLTRLESKDE